MVELPRQSRIILGDPPRCTPSQLEKIKAEKSKSIRSENAVETETYTTIDSDVRGIKVNQSMKSTILGLEVIEIEFDQTHRLTSHSKGNDLQNTKFVQTKSNIKDFSDTNPIYEPDIEKPESNISEPETYISTTTHIPDHPHSPHMKLIITNSLPPSLIAIKELLLDEDEKTHSFYQGHYRYIIDLFYISSP